MNVQERWSERLLAIREQGLARELLCLDWIGPTKAVLDGQQMDVFSSNDYLGLASHPDMLAAWQGGGSGSSRLISGTRQVHAELEDELARRYGRPVLVFSSGYQANIAVMSTLFDEHLKVASDRLNHASIIDGLRLSSCSVDIVEHGQFSSHADAHVVEGLYSMDGDCLDLQRFREGFLVVDEAHAVGCIGPNGLGVAKQQGIDPDVVIGTFGKAFGAAGAFVVCDQDAKELLISAGRSFVYTTALAESAAAAALLGVRLANDERRERLWNNTRAFRAGLEALGLKALGTEHIVPVVLGDSTMAVSARLRELGVFVPGIRYPTVRKGLERLRFSLSAEHSGDQISHALESLNKCI